MLKLTVKWKAKCKKHPRYDPQKEGEAGVKGGCAICLGLWNLYLSIQNFATSSAGEFVKAGR